MSEKGIGVRNLRLSFEKTFDLSIACLNLDLKAPSMILGPNGAGKSVFLRLLHGLVQPDQGNIRFPEAYRDKSAQSMVFQRPVLLRRTALANVAFPLQARGMSKADATQLAKTWMTHAELEKHFSSPARRLSGGEQQRLALARALALSPKVLLLDEPCAHLDPNAIVKVESMINSAIEAGVKVIMVTHDAAQAKRLGDELILMHRGEVVAQHPKEQFFAQTSNEHLVRFLAGEALSDAD
tara:strand:- start:216 stop:932 length:717 start_codon:yes stop_codon:yes gene_type:complete